jgi:hypothetical protein
MKKIFYLGIALLFVFSVAPAMAADQSLPQKGEMSLAKMTDQELASVQGGAVYRTVIINFSGFSRRYTNPGDFEERYPEPPDPPRIIINYWGRVIRW